MFDIVKDLSLIFSTGAKKSYVVAGAKLECNCGSCRSKLRMPVSHGAYIRDKAQMNIKDFKPVQNITTFGVCSNPKNPEAGKPNSCVPVITNEWINGKDDVLVENSPALLNTSTNTCIYDGVISIVDDGQE